MPLILDKSEVLDIYAEAAEMQWVLPTFNSENLTTTEAILSATLDYGHSIGKEDIPIIVGITNTYESRPQAVYYTHTKKWEIGMQLFLKDLEVLLSPESPYANLKVMIHLDHIQWDSDHDLLNWDMKQFSSIMYDASTLPLNENIEKTAKFYDRHSKEIVIEGACDFIGKTGHEDYGLTTPGNAIKYLSETGIDIIVANLGTEHRASVSELQYRSDRAKEITEALGRGCLCLHGTSSVSTDNLNTLFKDGVRKVNIWTALERESSKVLFKEMLLNSSSIMGADGIENLKENQLLGVSIDASKDKSISYYTTTYRQDVVFNEMKKIINAYLRQFYTIQ
jgi:fructose-bisphosphate aldolase class II